MAVFSLVHQRLCTFRSLASGSACINSVISLEGGDGLTIAKNARELIDTDVRVIDAVLTNVYKLQAAGKPVEYFTDGRLAFDVWEEE